MMSEKTQLLNMLKDEFSRWEELLARLSEEQITAPLPSSDLSIKDGIAHLRAWQQVSIARLDAALQNKDPEFPGWLAGQHPESDENRDEYNERIYQAYRGHSWSSVHSAWKEGFLRFLELAQAIPEADLLATGRYAWLKEYPLSAVLLGSYGHHEEHLEPLLALHLK